MAQPLTQARATESESHAKIQALIAEASARHRRPGAETAQESPEHFVEPGYGCVNGCSEPARPVKRYGKLEHLCRTCFPEPR